MSALPVVWWLLSLVVVGTICHDVGRAREARKRRHVCTLRPAGYLNPLTGATTTLLRCVECGEVPNQ